MKAWSAKEEQGIDVLEQEIKNMVTILEQIDLPDIILLTRDANTLLIRRLPLGNQVYSRR